MSAHSSAFDRLLASRARECVVQMRDPLFGGAIFTGFFISPDGLLITALHAVKQRKPWLPEDFDLELRLDKSAKWVTTRTHWQDDWYDEIADWALLRARTEQRRSYLPLHSATKAIADCAQVRVYGFTASDDGSPGIGALNGEFIRLDPERRRLRVAMPVRARGQSGGPVIDLDSQTVIGSAVGLRDDEYLTADATR